MAISWIKIANFALAKIGEASITSFGDGTPTSNAANLLYEQSSNEVLASWDWNCATARAALTQDATTPEGDDWDYQYDLPGDHLRLIELIDSDADYLLEGKKILCNEDEVSIRYVREISDPTFFPPYMIDAIACHLAYRLANKITEANTGLEQRMYLEYEAALLRAKQYDATQRIADEEPDLWTSVWSS